MDQAVEEALQTVARQQQLEILSTLTSEGKQPVPGGCCRIFLLRGTHAARDSRYRRKSWPPARTFQHFVCIAVAITLWEFCGTRLCIVLHRGAKIATGVTVSC